jgi:uncharacterized membrane protein
MKKKSSKKEIEESLKSFRTLNEKLQKEDEKNIIDKILTMVFTIDGFALIVCFFIAPLLHAITGKTYVGVVIFLIGLFGLAVHYISNLNKK